MVAESSSISIMCKQNQNREFRIPDKKMDGDGVAGKEVRRRGEEKLSKCRVIERENQRRENDHRSIENQKTQINSYMVDFHLVPTLYLNATSYP